MRVSSNSKQRKKPLAHVVGATDCHSKGEERSDGIELSIVERFKERIKKGDSWHLALLEAVGRWVSPEDRYEGREYRYLIHGEAFDWILLAERLCHEIDGDISQSELEMFLFEGRLPVPVTATVFKHLVGYNKHRAFLNYWYGVVVEEALQLAVEEELRKSKRSKGLPDSEDLVEHAHVTLYGDTRSDLFKQFKQEMKYPRSNSVTLTELKEFTYWLFKGRLKQSEPARVASDTRKGLERLARLRGSNSPF